MLSEKELRQLAEIIQENQDYFLERLFGTASISEKAATKSAPIFDLSPKLISEIFKFQYVLGKLQVMLTAEEYKKLEFSELQKIAKERWLEFKPKTEFDKFVAKAIEARVALGLRNLYTDIQKGVFKALGAVTAEDIRQKVKAVVGKVHDERKGMGSLNSLLVSELKASARNWSIVAATELCTAKQYAVLGSILEGAGIYRQLRGKDPSDIKVFVQVNANACEECMRDYLDDDGLPKVFSLAQLMSHGTNIGVPKKQRVAVVPPHHPYCYCSLNALLSNQSIPGFLKRYV